MPYQQLLTYFNECQAEMLATTMELVGQETPSSDKPRLDAFARVLVARLAAAGAQTEIIPNEIRGDHVRARWAGQGRAARQNQALILCHYDTVWPVGSLDTHPNRVDEQGWAYGPGIFDMQASLMLVEYVMRGLRDLQLDLPRPVTVLMTSDEEVGSPTSRALIEDEGRRSAYTLVLESPLPGGVLKTARKGGGRFQVVVRGRAAHAGVEPEKGINAIHELAHQILALQNLADAERGTTVSVGIVEGGSAVNVIPARAVAQIDVRAWTQDEVNRVSEAIYNLRPVNEEASLEVSGAANRPPLEQSATADLFGRAREIGKRVGLDLEEGRTGGGSDASWTGSLGIPTLDGLGVPGHGAHADHEHIEVDQIPGRAVLLAALLLDL